jgi:two-component system, cell cycle response regulator DivK
VEEMENRRSWNIIENTKNHKDFKNISSMQPMNSDPCEIGRIKNILVAEDEEFNRIFLGELLSDTNSRIIWALDGIQAVEHFKKHNIDLILMDIKMPRLGGIEATKQIRDLNSEVPIIAQTAFAMEDEERKFKDQGFSDYIKKPINIAEFLEKVDYWLNKNEIKSNLLQL